MLDWLLMLVNQLINFTRYLWNLILWVWDHIVVFAHWVVEAFRVVRGALVLVGKTILRAIKALVHLDFRAIWRAFKRVIDYIRKGLRWYYERILKPLDAVRRQIWDIYRRFFRPIILFLEKLRGIVRFIAIFNRKLAAKLDSRLALLESKLMWPIHEALKRVNAHSSYLRAMLTISGMLDRVLLVESIRRDCLLVWEVLTNPRARLFEKPKPVTPRGFTDMQRDFREYLTAGTGYYAETTDRLTHVFREALL